MAGFKHGSLAWACDQWATQSRPEGHSTRRYRDYYGHPTDGHCAIFFEGTRLYSHGHHYLLAELVTAGGQRVGLVNHDPYPSETRSGREIKDTPSTQFHRIEAWRALRRAEIRALEVTGLPFDPAVEIWNRRSKAAELLTTARRKLTARVAAYTVKNAAEQVRRAHQVAALFDMPVEPVTMPAVMDQLNGFAVRRLMADG